MIDYRTEDAARMAGHETYMAWIAKQRELAERAMRDRPVAARHLLCMAIGLLGMAASVVGISIVLAMGR